MLTTYGDVFTATGLSFKNALGLTHWEELAQKIKFAEKGHQWWIGDWFLYGEKVYGKTYQDVARQTGFAVKTLQNCSTVSRKIKPSLRRESLSWNHHNIVSKYSPDEQKKYLDLAEQKKLSVVELRNQLHQDHPKPSLEKQTPTILSDEESNRLLALFKTLVPSSITCDGKIITVKLPLRKVTDVERLATCLNEHYHPVQVQDADEMPKEEHEKVMQAANNYDADSTAVTDAAVLYYCLRPAAAASHTDESGKLVAFTSSKLAQAYADSYPGVYRTGFCIKNLRASYVGKHYTLDPKPDPPTSPAPDASPPTPSTQSESTQATTPSPCIDDMFVDSNDSRLRRVASINNSFVECEIWVPSRKCWRRESYRNRIHKEAWDRSCFVILTKDEVQQHYPDVLKQKGPRGRKAFQVSEEDRTTIEARTRAGSLTHLAIIAKYPHIPPSVVRKIITSS